MASTTTENTSQQKRCSLPGPIGALNLYTTHQQRRLSERGLMIYKPSKPDIDLIRDFTGTSKRCSSNFLCHPSGGYRPQRRHSAVIHATPSPSMNSPSASNAPFLDTRAYTERRHSSIITTSSPPFQCTSVSEVGGESNFPSFTYNVTQFTASNKQSDGRSSAEQHGSGIPNVNHPGMPPIPIISMDTCCGTSNTGNVKKNSGGDPTHQQIMPSSGGSTMYSGCRKVRLRIQKHPGTKEKIFELTPITVRCPISATTSPLACEDDKFNFMRRPQSDTRRHSDSEAIMRQNHIYIAQEGGIQPSIGNCRYSGIVCSTGDLLTLKCLTSSAQEIRCPATNSPLSTNVLIGKSSKSFGKRSRSFDTTIAMTRRGAGSLWFSRRHQPIAVKLPLPIQSPTISSPGDGRYFPGGVLSKTPILTITNANESKSELIEVPSPPAGSPASSNSPEEGAKMSGMQNNGFVAWDKNGFVLDAAVLGIAIENHLRKVDMRRRATYSSIYQTPHVQEPQLVARARSSSACAFPLPLEGTDNFEEGNGSMGSGNKSGRCRKSSLTAVAGGRLLSWDGRTTTTTFSTATTSVTFTNIGQGAAEHQTYETQIHRLPLTMDMCSTASAYLNNMDSPCSDSFVNFRAKEDDIEEEKMEESEEDEESQAFLPKPSTSSSSSQAGSSSSFTHRPWSIGPSATSINRGKGRSSTGSLKGTAPSSSASTSQQNEGNQNSGVSTNNRNRSTGMSICSAIRDFFIQSMRS